MESISTHHDIQVFGPLSASYHVLFCDLFGLYPRSFQSVIPELQAQYRIIYYTDHGFAPQLDEPVLRHQSLSRYADDLIEWLTANDIRNIIFIANSINALIALEAARKAPHLFHYMIFSSATACLPHSNDYSASSEMQEQKREILFQQILQNPFPHHASASSHHIIQLSDVLHHHFNSLPYATARQLFRMLFTTDYRPWLSELTVPVMILQVSSDMFATHEAGYYMYRNIPNSQLVKIKAKGQLPQVNAPEEFVLALQFIVNTYL